MFSVIIPSFNRRDYLLQCVESVAQQRLNPLEVIVVDDGSTDGTFEVLASMEGVTVLQQQNAGPGAARNRGAAAARGEYLAFLDSDDLWFPWTLEAVATLIARHDRPALMFLRFVEFGINDPEMVVEAAAEGIGFADLLAAAREGVFAGAGMMVVERAAFLAAGGFAEDRLNAEDHDLALRLGSARGFVQLLAPVALAHRLHGSNETQDLEKSLRGLERLVAAERRGGYPGGPARRADRWALITLHTRPVVLEALRRGDLAGALRLYCATFRWNLALGRVTFLVGALLLAARTFIVSLLRGAPGLR